MILNFYKYQGTGNDFVIIDNRALKIQLTSQQIASICDRRFGIGADGLILLELHPELDFIMNYYNSDGTQSFCGNGSRCIVQFARDLKIINEKAIYEAIDGLHHSKVLPNGHISTQMMDVKQVEEIGKDYFVHTGSPHYIIYSDNLEQIDITKEAHKIRFNDRFKKDGINVNFVKIENGEIHIRTYERGVENETLSCGTGVTAAAIAHCYNSNLSGNQLVVIHAKGGDLIVKLSANNGQFNNVELIGPAKFVFKGEITL